MRFRAILLGGVLVALACQRESGGGGRIAVAVDSPESAPRWVVDTVPAVDIRGGGVSGSSVLLYPTGATRLSDGTIVVADGVAPAVRFFDKSGRPMHSMGRQGRGPGEFGFISWLGQCAIDSVFLWDFMQTRMTVVDASGHYVRDYQVPFGPQATPPAVLACSRAGVFAFVGRPADLGVGTHASATFGRYHGAFWLGDAQGKSTRAMGEPLVYEVYYKNASNYPRPLGRIATVAVSADRAYLGTGDSAFVEAYDHDGSRKSGIALHVARRAPTRQNDERAIDALVAWLTESTIRDRMRARLGEIPMPDFLPPYSSLLSDPHSLLWAALSAPGDQETHLRGVRADGKIVADLVLSVGLTVFEVGEGYLIGAREDEAGEPHVMMFTFHRPAEDAKTPHP